MTDKQIKQTTSPGDFIFHAQWMPIFRSFPPEMAGRIIQAVIDYLENGVLPDDPQLKALCTFLFAHIDADRQRIADNFSTDEVKTHFLLKWSGNKVIGRQDSSLSEATS